MPPTIASRPIRSRWSGEGKKNILSDLTLSGDYVSGTGWLLTKQQLGFGGGDTLDYVDVEGGLGGYIIVPVRTAAGVTLRVYSAPGTEATTNLAALNGIAVRLLVTGN
jgi:hypothetical protein